MHVFLCWLGSCFKLGLGHATSEQARTTPVALPLAMRFTCKWPCSKVILTVQCPTFGFSVKLHGNDLRLCERLRCGAMRSWDQAQLGQTGVRGVTQT